MRSTMEIAMMNEDAEESAEPNDDDMMMDQVCQELMDALENKDKAAFKDAFDLLLSDIVNKIGGQ